MLRDNLMEAVDITVTGEDNAVFHNVFFDGLEPNPIDDQGTGTVTEIDGWGNVASLAATLNNLTVRLTDIDLPLERTLDEDGNLYIQPGDIVRIALDTSDLQQKISGVEAMLGFNTYFFTTESPSSLDGVDPWIYELHDVFSADGVYGKLDANVGLKFNYDSAEGTRADLQVADIALGSHVEAKDGVTQFYFRTRQDGDDPQMRTMLSGYDGTNDVELTPFTSNTGFITVDGTPPEINNFTATQVQDGVEVDVFDPVYTVQGTVVFTVYVYDETAGVDDEDVVLSLTHNDTSVVSTYEPDASEDVEIEDKTWTRYTFNLEVDASTENGVYTAEVDAADRSGNVSLTLDGVIEVDKNQIGVTVELQGAVEGPFTREVTFTATDSAETVLQTWVRTVEFTNGTGSDELVLVPEGTVRVSAKTNYHLRRRVDATLDLDKQGSAAFTVGDKLLGGDLNGDNLVHMPDFNRLRYHWFAANHEADITGDGVTGQEDFNILSANWFEEGDPE